MNWIKKTIGIIILFSVVLGLVLPMCYVSAREPWGPVWGQDYGTDMEGGWLSGKIGEVGEGIIKAVSEILAKIALFPLEWAYDILTWVTGDEFISLSFTGQDNPVVQEGWGIVRNFTNMFIILGFVLIALATILRQQEYQAQKLLPLLIGIALLINFTPVICGFMIDASNMPMNYFLSTGAGTPSGQGFVNELRTNIDAIQEQNYDLPVEIVYYLLIAFFGIGGAIIIGLLAFLFAVRYVALWILIILSPIAFFCYVFSFTKQYFTMWWNQFFQWCIIGIPAAFFIYLSNILIKEISTQSLTGQPTGGISQFGNLFVYIVPLIFLYAGLMVSLKSGAAGADMVISGAKRAKGVAIGASVKGGKWAGKKAGTFAKERVPARLLRSAEKAAGYTPKSKWSKRAYKYTGVGLAGRQIARLGTAHTASERADIAKEKELASKKDASGNLTTLRSLTASKSQKIAALQASVEKGQVKEWEKLGLSKDEKKKIITDIGKSAIKIHPKEFSQIRDADPLLTEKIVREFPNDVRERVGGKLSENDIQLSGIESLNEKTIAGLDNEKLKKLDISVVLDDKFLKSFLKHADGSKIGTLAKTFGKSFIDKMQTFTQEQADEKTGGDIREWYLKEAHNTAPINYLHSTGASSLGFNDIGNKVTDDEKKTFQKTEIRRKSKLLVEIHKTETGKDILLTEKGFTDLKKEIQKLEQKETGKVDPNVYLALKEREEIYKKALKIKQVKSREIPL